MLPWRDSAERQTWLEATPAPDRHTAEDLLELVETRGVALFRPSAAPI